MIVKFFRKGRGQSKGALDYFLGKDRKREHAKILSGTEQEVAELIDSSPYTKKYTSGCLSFHEDDLTPQVKTKLMRAFEQCLFPGMDESQYRVLWIEHRDKDNKETGKKRLELNFLIPNVEITTGDRLQPYYFKADQSRVDLFKKIINFEYDLHDPNDPLNRQAITTKKDLPTKTAEIKAVLDAEALKAIESGVIQDRKSMKKWLINLGLEITRDSAKSISIKNPNDEGGNSRPIRLTGAIYEQDFRITAESAELTREASERYRREAQKRYEGDLQRYQDHLDRKSRELEEKYRLHEGNTAEPLQRSDSSSLKQDRTGHQSPQESPSNSHQRTDTATVGADPSPTSALASIEPLEPRNSESSQHKKNPYYFDYSLSFSDSYFAYHNHLFRVREQKQMGRDPSPKREVTADRSDHTAEDPRVSNYHHQPVQSEIKAIGNHNEQDLRSSVVGSYRRATATAEEATARASESLRAYTDTNRHHRGTASVRTNPETASVSHSGSSEGVSAGTATDLARKSLRAIIKDFTSKLGQTVERTFRELGEWFKHREADQSSLGPDLAEASATRNREADQATSRSNTDEIGLSRAVSREIRGFDTAGIFKALDELDRRKMIKQEKRNDNDQDSLPSPF